MNKNTKIAEVLSKMLQKLSALTFSEETETEEVKLMDYTLASGEKIRVMEDTMVVMYVDENGEVTEPLADGEYELEDGMIMVVTESKMVEIKEKSVEAEMEMMMHELVNGMMVKHNSETGEGFLVDAEGNEVPVPVGEHETVDGMIIIVTEEGMIADMVEKSEMAMNKVLEKFERIVSEIENYRNEIKAVMEKNIELEAKIEKFSNTPVANPIDLAPKFDVETEKSTASDKYLERAIAKSKKSFK